MLVDKLITQFTYIGLFKRKRQTFSSRKILVEAQDCQINLDQWPKQVKSDTSVRADSVGIYASSAKWILGVLGNFALFLKPKH